MFVGIGNTFFDIIFIRSLGLMGDMRLLDSLYRKLPYLLHIQGCVYVKEKVQPHQLGNAVHRLPKAEQKLYSGSLGKGKVFRRLQLSAEILQRLGFPLASLRKGGPYFPHGPQNLFPPDHIAFPLPCQALFFTGRRGFFDHLPDLPLVTGLEDVVLYSIFHGLLGIIEFSISGKNDELNINLGGTDLFNQIQSGKAGHTDVGQNNIRTFVYNHIKGFQSVFTDSRQLNSHVFPAEHLAYGFPDDLFIIHQNDLPHTSPPLQEPGYACLGQP